MGLSPRDHPARGGATCQQAATTTSARVQTALAIEWQKVTQNRCDAPRLKVSVVRTPKRGTDIVEGQTYKSCGSAPDSQGGHECSGCSKLVARIARESAAHRAEVKQWRRRDIMWREELCRWKWLANKSVADSRAYGSRERVLHEYGESSAREAYTSFVHATEANGYGSRWHDFVVERGLYARDPRHIPFSILAEYPVWFENRCSAVSGTLAPHHVDTDSKGEALAAGRLAAEESSVA